MCGFCYSDEVLMLPSKKFVYVVLMCGYLLQCQVLKSSCLLWILKAINRQGVNYGSTHK